MLCCGYTLTDFPISIRLTSLALWQSNDCPSASKATLMNMDKYFMWIHYERLHNHNKAKHNKTVCIFLGIYCMVCLLTSPPRCVQYWTTLYRKFIVVRFHKVSSSRDLTPKHLPIHTHLRYYPTSTDVCQYSIAFECVCHEWPKEKLFEYALRRSNVSRNKKHNENLMNPVT